MTLSSSGGVHGRIWDWQPARRKASAGSWTARRILGARGIFGSLDLPDHQDVGRVIPEIWAGFVEEDGRNGLAVGPLAPDQVPLPERHVFRIEEEALLGLGIRDGLFG